MRKNGSLLGVLVGVSILTIFYQVLGAETADSISSFLGRFIIWVVLIAITSIPIVAGFFVGEAYQPKHPSKVYTNAEYYFIPTIVAIIFYFLARRIFSGIGFNFDVFDILFNTW